MQALITKLNEQFDLTRSFNTESSDEADNFALSIIGWLVHNYGVTLENAVYGNTVYEGTSTNGVVSSTLYNDDWDSISNCFYVSSASGNVFLTVEAAMLASTAESFDSYVEDGRFSTMQAAIAYDWQL